MLTGVQVYHVCHIWYGGAITLQMLINLLLSAVWWCANVPLSIYHTHIACIVEADFSVQKKVSIGFDFWNLLIIFLRLYKVDVNHHGWLYVKSSLDLKRPKHRWVLYPAIVWSIYRWSTKNYHFSPIYLKDTPLFKKTNRPIYFTVWVKWVITLQIMMCVIISNLSQ